MHLHDAEISLAVALYNTAKDLVHEKDRDVLAGDFVTAMSKSDIDMDSAAHVLAELDQYMANAVSEYIDDEDDDDIDEYGFDADEYY
jgi:hypothetical protein